ncbi:MAG: DUF3820 family protein [Ferruginibacter sp.]
MIGEPKSTFISGERKLIMEEPSPGANNELLIQLVTMAMSFGKYKGTLLCDLPVAYLEWFQRKGFPNGKLGMLLAAIYEIKLNGLEYLLKPLKKHL